MKLAVRTVSHHATDVRRARLRTGGGRDGDDRPHGAADEQMPPRPQVLEQLQQIVLLAVAQIAEPLRVAVPAQIVEHDAIHQLLPGIDPAENASISL